MKEVTEQEVKLILFANFKDHFAGKNLSPEDISDNFDLFTEGIIDSMGIVEMIAAIEKHLGTTIDFEKLPAEELTIVGPFCRYVAAQANNGVY